MHTSRELSARSRIKYSPLLQEKSISYFVTLPEAVNRCDPARSILGYYSKKDDTKINLIPIVALPPQRDHV